MSNVHLSKKIAAVAVAFSSCPRPARCHLPHIAEHQGLNASLLGLCVLYHNEPDTHNAAAAAPVSGGGGDGAERT